MKALVFDLSIPKYVAARGLGKVLPSLYYGRGSMLALKDVPRPQAPSSSWVRLKSKLCGLCGTDLATIFLKVSPQLEPFSSSPMVLGHEILAVAMEGPHEGRRVVVDPFLPCDARGIRDPCRACARGSYAACERKAEGCLAPGTLLGAHRDLPGGMGEELVAPERHVFPVQDGISDEAAVMIEPLAVALRAVLQNPPQDDERVLILGGGPIAFCVLWALQATGSRADVALATFEQYQLALATELGVAHALKVGDATETAYEVARLTGARVFQPSLGGPVLAGGFDLVYDCVGNEASTRDALRYARACAKVVLLGCASTLDSVDWTAVWANELTIQGSYAYGRERWRGEELHTFEVVQRLLVEKRGFDPGRLVTHRFPLSRYQDAILASRDRAGTRSMKAVFDLEAA